MPAVPPLYQLQREAERRLAAEAPALVDAAAKRAENLRAEMEARGHEFSESDVRLLRTELELELESVAGFSRSSEGRENLPLVSNIDGLRSMISRAGDELERKMLGPKLDDPAIPASAPAAERDHSLGTDSLHF